MLLHAGRELKRCAGWSLSGSTQANRDPEVICFIRARDFRIRAAGKLVWPAGISKHLEDAHLEAILAHEIWHVRRRDNLAAVMHMVVASIFWFYPLVWWLGKRFGRGA